MRRNALRRERQTCRTRYRSLSSTRLEMEMESPFAIGYRSGEVRGNGDRHVGRQVPGGGGGSPPAGSLASDPPIDRSCSTFLSSRITRGSFSFCVALETKFSLSLSLSLARALVEAQGARRCQFRLASMILMSFDSAELEPKLKVADFSVSSRREADETRV